MKKFKKEFSSDEEDEEEESEAAKRQKTEKKKVTSKTRSQRKTGGAATSNPPPQKETEAGKETITMDADLLDCSICENHLYPPVNQCKTGHVACSSCWDKLQYKCHLCGLRVQFRNIAMEKVLEAVHVPCTFSNLGCRMSVSYSQRQAHTETCEYGRPPCPIPDCDHNASSGEWREHFQRNHQNPGSHFTYGESFTILMGGSSGKGQGDPYYTLFGPDKDLFLLVKESNVDVGYALSLYCIDPPLLGRNVFSYELKVRSSRSNTSSVQTNSQVVSIKEWKMGEVHGSFLMVPSGYSLSGDITVRVLINNKVDVISLD